MGKNEYEEKRQEFKKLLKKAASDLDAADDSIRDLRDASAETARITDESRDRVIKFTELADLLPTGSSYEPSQDMCDLLDSGAQMAGTLAAHSSYLRAEAEDLASAGEQVLWTARVNQTTTSSLSPVISTIGDTLSYECPEVRKAIGNLSLPTRADRQYEVAEWLASLEESLLVEKHAEAHAAFLDGDYMSAAHAMRDTLAHVLGALAPDKDVRARPWFKGAPENGHPMQVERVKYAVLGLADEHTVPSENLRALNELMSEARDIYQKLSGEAHRRKGEWLRRRIEQYFEIAEQVMLQVRDLRERFFVSKKPSGQDGERGA